MNTVNEPRYLIVGLGISGLSCARYLRAQNVAFDFADSRESPQTLASFEREFVNSQFILGAIDFAKIKHYHSIVLSPGFDPRVDWLNAAKAAGIQIIGEIELFARAIKNQPVKVIGITGTNGKSTVTVMVGQLLQAAGFKVAIGGNLGTAALDLLADDVQIYVLELSSFQLETTTSLQLATAVVLNLSQDHGDRYADFQTYAAQKMAIYQMAECAVFNMDDEYIEKYKSDYSNQSRIGFSVENIEAEFNLQNINLGEHDIVDMQSCLCYRQEMLLPVGKMQLKGAHNYANALAALALCHAVCKPDSQNYSAVLHALSQFGALEHRLQFVDCIDDIACYNDSKATNVGASIAAITGFQQAVVVLIGGAGKAQDFAPLAKCIAAYNAKVITIGSDKNIAQNFAQDCHYGYAHNMQTALDMALECAHECNIKIILLAPACASTDQYPDFKARGNDFVQCVKAYKARS